MARNLYGTALAAVWTPEQDAMLRQCVMAGDMTGSQIASAINREFGTAFSRNAAIGRSYRLKIHIERALKPAKPRKPRMARIRNKTAPLHEAAEPAGEPMPPLGIRCEDLELAHCRWPYGDGPIVFCGHDRLDDGPDCAPHALLSVRAPAPR